MADQSRFILARRVGLAACCGVLASTASLVIGDVASVSAPMFLTLMAGGLLLGKEPQAPVLALAAGGLGTVHAAVLLASGRQASWLMLAFLTSALVLAVSGWVMHKARPQAEP